MIKHIPIRNIQRGGHKDSAWSENFIKKEILPAGTQLFHVSIWGELDAFAPVVTCFSFDRPVLDGDIYMLKVIKPIRASIYEDEVRIDLGNPEISSSVDIVYVGRTALDLDLVIVDKAGRTIEIGRKYIVEPEFAELGERWNKRNREKIYSRVRAWGHIYHLESEEAK